MRHLKRYPFLVIGLVILVVGFNNCSQSFEVREGAFEAGSSAYQAVCESQLRTAFQNTYHPFLSKNCNLCHSGAQGSRDVNTAYQAFRARGEELIDYQSTHAHGGNNFNSSMQVEIDKFKPTWTLAQSDFNDCMARGASAAGGSGGASGLLTVPKAIPNIERTATNNSWVTAEWDLEREVDGWAAGRFKATLRAETRLHTVGGEVVGLLIRNPTIQLKSGSSNILVNGLMIAIDGRKQAAVTTYLSVSKIISGTTQIKLLESSASAYAAYPGFSNSSRLGFEFGELSNTTRPPEDITPPVIPDPVAVDIPDIPIPAEGVTFAQLTNSSSPYRVFNRSCVGCHGANSGRINLSNYDEASAAAALISQRMNDAAAPMPPTGLLRQNDRDIVQSWIRVGTPRN